jgi:hypothetical protein
MLAFLANCVLNVILCLFCSEKVQNQKDTDEAVCSYIAGMIEQNYNEYGEIIAGREELKFANLVDYNTYLGFVHKIAPSQVFGIIISCCTMLGLATYACILRHKLTKRNAALATRWQPMRKTGDSTLGVSFGRAFLQSRSTMQDHNTDVSRVNSGIMMMRSVSHQSMEHVADEGAGVLA